MVKEIFKHVRVDFEKLEKYGFKLKKDNYKYTALIANGQFNLTVIVAKSGSVKTQVIDISTGDEYSLHMVKDAVGGFVGLVRSDFESVLLDIKEKCFEKFVFKSKQSQEVIGYVQEKYGDELEYLWTKFPTNAVWRRKDNGKWYGALLVVSKRKLKIESDEIVDIIDLRIDANDLEKIVDNKKYFAGYHMNKKNWFTICLDGSVETQEIFEFIDKSYLLAKNK